MNTKNKKITMGTLLLTSIIGVISVSLYFTYYGTPWGKQAAIAESKEYITKYFDLDAEAKILLTMLNWIAMQSPSKQVPTESLLSNIKVLITLTFLQKYKNI